MTVRPTVLLTVGAILALGGAACGSGHPTAAAVHTPAPSTASATPPAPATTPLAAAITPTATRAAPSPSRIAVAPVPAAPVPPPKATTALPAVPPPVAVQTLTIGQSAKGRPITAVEYGDPGAQRKLVVVGCIHGNEQAGIAIARQLEQLAPPAGTDVWVIEDLNPDGAAANTRQNANGVDLNRNFPYAWQPLESPGMLMYSGPAALSEPESQAAVDFLNKVRPTVSIWFHQHEDLVDLSGGDASIEQRYASMVGLRTLQLQRYPGSVTSWENATFPGSTAFVVELPAGSLTPAAAIRYAAAALKIV